ncbi:MAG: hypothetical protein OEY01_03630 [Desulfobulbaceae bacterium]|nr:hypothetical protein [Desulfobulbaceae bacterium]
MSYSLRMVKKGWEHPTEYRYVLKERAYKEKYIPLCGRSYTQDLQEWMDERAAWKGEGPYEEYAEDAPQYSLYMPEWSEEEKTHYQIYETISEGTPLCPPCETPEEAARYVSENFEGSVDYWLFVIEQKWVPSLVYIKPPSKS